MNPRLVRIWKNMRSRCNNPDHPKYPRYGGRSIRICPEWSDLATFCSWAEANGYTDELEIDRVNNDAGYFPGNCRWTTRRENVLNRPDTVQLSAFGETKPLTVWLEDDRCLVNDTTLRHRLDSDWPTERALATPLSPNGEKTHCPQGHPYDAANTYHRPNGGRTCRACNRESAARARSAA